MKLAIIILLSIMPVFCSAQIRYSASLDYSPNFRAKIVSPYCVNGQNAEYSSVMDYGMFRVRIGATYAYKFVSIYFDQHVYMSKARGISFNPVHAEWSVGASVKIYKGIKFEYSHTCLHPILSDNQYAKRSKMYGGCDVFSISYGY